MSYSRALSSKTLPFLEKQLAYIGGEWCKAADNATFEVKNPANGEVLGSVANVGKAEAQEAVSKASNAYHTWKKTTVKERCLLMKKWYRLLMENIEDIAKLITLEAGKPVAQARGEIAYGGSFIDWFAEEAKRTYGDIIPTHVAGRRLLVVKEACGVAALWVPWNFPLAMLTRKAAPALAAGCTVICKPSEDTPFTALALAQLAEEAGIPPGVFNVLPCSRSNAPEVTDVIMNSALVTNFSFTGSTETGQLMLEKCAKTVKKTSMELGGNAAFIVFDSADVEAAARNAAASKFRNSGQACVATNRIFVHDTVYEEFVGKFVENVKKLVVANGMDEDSDVGPLINAKAIEKVERHVSEAIQLGAKVVCGGKKSNLGGSFFEPTVLADATNDMSVSQEETFGPIAPVIRFKTEEEAIKMANGTKFGLAGYVFTQNISQAWRVMEALEVGMVGVNEGLISTEGALFGGVKQSGLGREGSKYGIEEFIETKYVCLGGISP
ncbi:uncharacterized protein LOC114533470 [Dendronephthya gigantea]|uniref:uncharacterized protein LOC114533470 n=1 Tax=Dendronephthya gigantea TaxID=151771 RepID=UPI00106DC0AA|nr:uncharacterized protein LOC114533470 [Dendronephthya gigantea]